MNVYVLTSTYPNIHKGKRTRITQVENEMRHKNFKINQIANTLEKKDFIKYRFGLFYPSQPMMLDVAVNVATKQHCGNLSHEKFNLSIVLSQNIPMIAQNCNVCTV